MDSNNSVWQMLNDLSNKSGISEIIINKIDNVFIERQGEMIRLNMKLVPEHIVDFCKDVAKYNKTSFGSNHPIIDGTLPDGSRINIISSAYTTNSPAITIRKYLKHISSFDAVEDIFNLDKKWVEFMKTLVASKMNIVVSGSTGAGKTTFLNLMLQEVSPTERVVTIEDTKELSFNIPNSVRLVSRSSSSNVDSPLKIRDLLKNTLRMRPDRIIIGEVRSEEAFDLLQAMNTGHNGSMCTIHANTPAESLTRLENLFMFSGFDIPIKAIRQQMSSAIDFIVQLDRNREGERIVKQVTEVSNLEGDKVLLQDIGRAEDGKIKFTGLVPKRMDLLMDEGLTTDFFLDI